MNLQKLCLHTITTKPWSLEEALDQYTQRGIGGVSIWQNAIEEMGARKAGELVQSYDIEVVSYVRGGFFPSASLLTRNQAIDHNKKLIEEAAELNAPILVLVCGADPGQSLSKSRLQILHGIEALLPHCASHHIKLAIEPLHPMYADNKSAINTMKQANDIAEQIDTEWVGIAVDVYHTWWDPDLRSQIERCGKNQNLYAFHICDWKTPTLDLLNDREIMGKGCIIINEIKNWVNSAGFDGYNEVEIFSTNYWNMDQSEFLNEIIQAYENLIE